MTSATPSACPVCRAMRPRHFGQFDGRAYWRCNHCEATGLDPAHFPDRTEERAHYLHHENHIHDPGYRQFLSRLADPLLPLLTTGMSGLDYGCGPGPALAAMLTEAGYRMALYDPFFHSDPAPLTDRYDFITCTETAEHFHHPADEFDQLSTLLNPGGWLAVMTCFQTEDSRFGAWHYRKDPTHVVFYRATTFRQIAQAHGWSCTIPAKDVALMQRPGA